MKIWLAITSVTKKLKWLLLVAMVVAASLDFPHYQWFGRSFMLLIFIEPGQLQSYFQLLGGFVAWIRHGFRLPSKENYKCKGDYILPFTGKWTVLGGGVDRKISHSWIPVNQRYAYDFIVIDDEGKRLDGDGNLVQSFFCHGQDIVAPADGVVVALSNKHKDSRVANGSKVFCDAWDLRGNYITIKHHDREYSFTAHILQDSFTVKVGDEVKQGQVIAKCGNSGNTTEPHIHFQLQTGKSFLFSAGLPIEFSNIKAEESVGYIKVHEILKVKLRSLDGNLQSAHDGKVYIGRGLNVENGITES
jgi:hypothetical protein